MIAAGLLYLGFFALAASMSRHRPALLGRWQGAPFARRHLPLAGWSLVAASLLAVLADFSGGIALVTWAGLLPMTAGIILLGLTYDVRLTRAGVAGAAILILGGTVAAL